MTAATIREMLHSTPFRPFEVITSDGSRWPVTHPDFLSVSPASDAIVIYKQTGGLTIISPSQVSAVDFQPASG